MAEALSAPKKRRKKPVNCSRLFMDYMRAKGWEIGLVEQRIPHTFITRDFLGFVDMIAVNGQRIVGVQVTSRGNTQSRVSKSMEQEAFKAFTGAAEFFVVGVDIKDGSARFRFLKVTEEGALDVDGI